MAEKKHKYSHTTVEHHKDGSHTTTHHHEEGEHKNKKYATADHDSMIDGMMDHTSEPNPGEAEAEAGNPEGEAAGVPGGASAGV